MSATRPLRKTPEDHTTVDIRTESYRQCSRFGGRIVPASETEAVTALYDTLRSGYKELPERPAPLPLAEQDGKMIDLALTPLRSVGPLGLGATSDAIGAAAVATFGIGPRRVGRLDYVAGNAIQVEYDAAGGAQFIGVSAEPALYRLTFSGVDLFDQPADAVRALFAAGATVPSGRVGEDHLGTLIFPDQIVALWSADTQYDRVRLASGARPLRRIWAQIGIGSPAYLTVIRSIG